MGLFDGLRSWQLSARSEDGCPRWAQPLCEAANLNQLCGGGTPEHPFADDEIPNHGPFGDPRTIIYTAAADQCITAIVTNFLSGPDSGGDGAFDYMIGVQAAL